MSKTIELKQQEESLDTMDNKNFSNIELLNVENTPFTIIKQGEEYFGVIGEHRITESYEDLEKLKKEIKEITWDRITQVIWAVVNKFNKVKLEDLTTK